MRFNVEYKYKPDQLVWVIYKKEAVEGKILEVNIEIYNSSGIGYVETIEISYSINTEHDNRDILERCVFATEKEALDYIKTKHLTTYT